MKKILVACLFSLSLYSVSPIVIRTKTTAPLLFGTLDVKHRDAKFSVAPLFNRSLTPDHMARALTVNEKESFTLSEQGSGVTVDADVNPLWFGLTTQVTGSGAAGTYKSKITFEPEIKMNGVLLHASKKFESLFFDVRTALLQATSNMNITESTGGDGAFDVTNFLEAMSNESWNYGKMGEASSKFGLDNIQLIFGTVGESDSNRILTVYLLTEIPTGKGSTAEWMVEPRIGTNHFGLGVGLNEHYTGQDGEIIVGANWRYLFAAKETRSFDLQERPWSRYMRVIALPVDAANVPDHGINYFTREATITPGNQLQSYMRWLKRAETTEFELGYNFFYRQAEKIDEVAEFDSQFGLYDAYNNDVLVTVNSAKIDTLQPVQDATPTVLTVTDLDVESAAVSTLLLSSFSARLDYVGQRLRCGVGGLFESAHSKSAYSSWSVWVHLGLKF